jgi:integrase/recombinase XerD
MVDPSRVRVTGPLELFAVGFAGELGVQGYRGQGIAAIRSLYRYAALRHPEHAATIERVLAIPPKRFESNLVAFLTEEELDTLLDAPDRSTWPGRRDHAIIMLAAQTGLRASEIVGLTCGDVHLGSGAHVTCVGKGRKQRITPLMHATVTVLDSWLAERGGAESEPLFPTSTGRALSRDALDRRLAKHTPPTPPSAARH